jgi:transposase
MERMFSVCAGIDVHKKVLYVCLLKVGPDSEVRREVRNFGTMTCHLLSLCDWLVAEGCQSVAMESTGVYWKPVFNLLEPLVKVVLANAQHVKALPGRKTDVKDCEWLADLHLHGLIRPSFIPPVEIRELRDLVRTRTKLIGERAQHVNRVQKVFEDANIKLGSVASDVLGVSGRAMLEGIIAGETDPKALADQARGRLRSKHPLLLEALRGRVRAHHRLLLQTHLGLIDNLQAAIGTLTREIEERMRPFAEIRERLDRITGIGQDVATVYISEVGVDPSPWPSYQHAASWVGLCPGHHQSAGKRKSGRPHPGNRWIKQAFVQAAWSAQRANGTYMQAHFRRICTRRGAKKAAGAVAHSLFVRCFLIATGNVEYRELGGTYYDERHMEAVKRRLVHRLEDLGYQVALTPTAA